MGLGKLKIVWLLVVVFMGISCSAQTYAEFFRQKKTQQKYLMEQLVALKIYAGYLKKGYDIASSGLNTVRDFTRGELGLHDAFIRSLKTVSPVIKNNTKVADIILWQLEISRAFRGISSGSLGTMAYIDEVKSGLMEACDSDLGELLLVITSGKIEMKDDERLQRLDKIHASMLDKYAFAQSFSHQVNLINGQRQKEQRSIEELRRFYETN